MWIALLTLALLTPAARVLWRLWRATPRRNDDFGAV